MPGTTRLRYSRQVQVTKHFPFNSEPSALVLSRLGLPQDTLIKTRRMSATGAAINLKTFSGPVNDRQRSERLWATMRDVRRDNLSRSRNGARKRPAVGDNRDADEEHCHIDIFPVTATEVIKAGDILYLSCAKASGIFL